MLLRVFKISGHSMMPTFSPDDHVLVSNIPYWFNSPKIDDIVVFKFKEKFMIKRISRIENNYYSVSGDNKSDTLKIPKITKKEILGKVVTRI